MEAPVFAPGAGGPSGLLLDLAIPEGEDDESVLSIEVPLHARYGVPKTEGEPIDEILLPPPEAFWACAREGAVGSGGGGTSRVSPIPPARNGNLGSHNVFGLVNDDYVDRRTYVQQDACKYPTRCAK